MWEPESLDEVVGQVDAVGAGKRVIGSVQKGKRSLPYLLYGPPGTGKSTIAGFTARAVRDVLCARHGKRVPRHVLINASMDRSPVKLAQKLYAHDREPRVFQIEEIDSMQRESQLTLAEFIAEDNCAAAIVMTCNVFDAVDPLLRDSAACVHLGPILGPAMIKFVKSTFRLSEATAHEIAEQCAGDVRRAATLSTMAAEMEASFGPDAALRVVRGPCSVKKALREQEPIDELGRHLERVPVLDAMRAVVGAMRSVTVTDAFVADVLCGTKVK